MLIGFGIRAHRIVPKSASNQSARPHPEPVQVLEGLALQKDPRQGTGDHAGAHCGVRGEAQGGDQARVVHERVDP